MDAVKPAGAEAMSDGSALEAEREELRPRHDAVLPRRKRSDGDVS
jgi:hypothetical protein